MNTPNKSTPKIDTQPPRHKNSFQERLAESFKTHPHHIAIEFGEHHISYALLERQADVVAQTIIQEGILPQSFIGICVDDKINIIALIIGILKARCAFVLLDTALPIPRLLNMIRLTHVQTIFTTTLYQERVFGQGHGVNDPNPLQDKEDEPDEQGPKLILIDFLFAQPPHLTYHTDHPYFSYHREDKIYIYFTSGTTGVPKAMVGMNKSLLHFIDWEIETFHIDSTFRFSQWITPGFDAFLRDIFTPLCAGAVICIPPRKEMVLDSQEVIPWLNARHISLIHCVPSMFRLLNVFTKKEQAAGYFISLRYVLMAGEKVVPHELARWYAIFQQQVQLVNLYGASETTLVKTCYFIQPEDCERSVIPVGKPLPGARIFILDKNLQVCSKISTGEIFIRTPFRTHGYCNDPEATHDKFIPNPFTHDPHDWFYKTGDLGRILEDGNLEVLGRIDRQVKVRGVRVEPEEIENVLLKHPRVSEATIIDKESDSGDVTLCAYFVPHLFDPDGHGVPAITSAELMQFLSSRLPPYMVPTYITPLDKMPLTANGKIDRRALPEPLLDQGQFYAPPTNELEEKLVHIWAEVLHVDATKISIHANFFHLGGHSLNATILVSKIHRLLGIKVPLAEIFKNPIVKSLAQYMTTSLVPGTSFSAIEPAEIREYYPLSSAQKRLYFLQQFDLTSTGYNMPMVIPLGKGVNIDGLENILQTLILRHENFRTAFIQVQDETFQRIFSQVDFALKVFDLTDPVIQNNAQQVGVLIQNFVRPFDLSRAPLFRCGLIRTPEDEYIWLVDMHHIISDGTSQTILTRDFFALAQGQHLPPLHLQYKDFSQWQNRLFADGSIHLQEQFWMSQLAGELPRLDFPIDYQRPPIFTFAGARDSFNVEPQDAIHFRALGDAHGATLYMNVLAALNVLFFKYTQQTDIIIGSAIAGRHHADLQHIVGMFVNTLVMRNTPLGEKTYSSFLNEVRESCIHVFENQDVQFEQLVEKLDLERDPSRNPLFDVSLVVQNFIQTGQEMESNETHPQLEVVPVPDAQSPVPRYENNISKFDMTIFINEMGQDISIQVQYYTGIFKPETIQRFISHLTQLIKIVTVDPTVPLKNIQLLTEPEKQRIISEFNNTHREYPTDKTIHQLFEAQMERTPDHIALFGATVGASPRGCPDLAPCPITCQITYAQLHAQSSHLAQILINKGVCPDDIIGIMGERSINTIIGILGILKAGGAYLPIDPDYPEERKHFMVADSCARIILTEDSIHEFIGGASSETRATTGGCPYGYPAGVMATNLAYVIYTSGSTGLPKGVMVEHRNVVRLVKNTNYIDFLPEDRIQQTGALEFDASTFEIWGALLNSLPLCLESKEDILNPELLRHFILRNKITILWLTTQLFNQMVQMEIHLFAPLRCVLTGGEVASPPHIRQLVEQFPRLRLIHCYGPTENTTFSTTDVFQPQLLEKISIGKPIANSTAYILDPAGHLLPIGIVGELWVGGDGVARGYLNNPELTAATFTSHALLSTPSTTSTLSTPFYKTGDLARWLPDGNIDFIGRKDHQVKIRGFRIEMGEIETQLLTHPHIQEAVVLVREDQKTEKYLCAYIVSTTECDDSQLREYLGQTLPDYMIPTFFIPLQKIPLNASGKTDRRALPQPQFTSTQGIESPRNELESQLVAIWSEVLHIEPARIGINSHFFQLGGHSLNATIVVSKIHRQLGFKIPLAELFKTPFIKGLSQYITSQRGPGKQFLTIEPAETREYYPLSSAQKRLYFLQQFDLTSTSYNMPMVIPLGSGIELHKLDGVLQTLIQRHDNFRTSFIQVQDETVQRIQPRVDFAFDIFDLTPPERIGKADNGANISVLIQNFVRPFDLSRAPLLRCGLIRTPEDQYIWLVDMHHIISDGTSQSILTRDFFALAQEQHLPPLQLQYKDFSQWQNRLFADGGIQSQEEYWLSQLDGELPRLDFPADFKRPPVFTFEGAQDSFMLEPEDALLFRALGNSQNATLFMNILAALNVLFFKYTQQTDIIIGSAIAGRHHADLQLIVGMFVNTLVLRNAPQGEKTYLSFLNEVRESCIHAFENQDVQFEQLVEKLDLERDPSRNPLFDISLAVQNFSRTGQELEIPATPTTAPPVEVVPVPDSQSPAPQYQSHISKFDMTFFINEIGQDIAFQIQYYTSIFKPETIQRLISHLTHLIKAINQNPTVPLNDIQLLTEQEKQRIIYEFNNTHREYPQDKTIHQLFEAQMERTPDHIALFGATVGASPRGCPDLAPCPITCQITCQITYAQLHAQSSHLAQILINKGVCPADIIGILGERSINTIIGILGILKAGGAYLPIDPDYPEERKHFMVADSCARIILTEDSIHEFIGGASSETRATTGGCPYGCPAGVMATNLAYVIYTSGSTGLPKGVMVEHRNVVRLVKNTNYIDFLPHDRILQTGALEFDASTFEIWGALLNGLPLCLESKEDILNPELLKYFILRNKITILWLTTQLFNQMVQMEIHLFAPLRCVLTGGEVASPPHIRQLREQFPRLRLIHCYGPTENTTFSTTDVIQAQVLEKISIGKPIANSTTYIVDPAGHLLPIGIVGELWVGGDGVARGYLNNPELTAATFTTHSLLSTTSTMSTPFYKTGDLARWLPDGNIDFIGRKDHQVKIRGFRIELGEIETQLLTHPQIQEAVVLVREDQITEKYLCAYIVSTTECDDSQLREFLGQTLPDYMIPTFFVPLQKIPLNASGKTDHRALPQPQFTSTQGFEAPRNELESQLVAIWSEVLNIEPAKVGITSHFFQLGGHSLNATIVISKIHRQLGFKIPLAELFKTPFIKGLSQYITSQRGPGKQFLTIEPAEAREYYPLSSAQKRLYFLQQFDLTSTSYNMPMVIPLGKGIEFQKLDAILQALIQRHDNFRTSFIQVQDETMQRILPRVDFAFDIFDLTAPKTAPMGAVIQNFVRPFDLSRAPLLRCGLIRTPEDQYIWLVDMHHIISDGTSQTILTQDFFALAQEQPLPPLQLQYKDFSQWQNRLFADGGILSQEEYWLRQLSGELPRLDLPADFKRPPVFTFAGADDSFLLEPQDAIQFRALGQTQNATLFMNTLAVLNVLFFKYTQQTDIIIGSGIAGRHHADLQHIVGMFVNTLVLRNAPQGEKTYLSFLKEVCDTCIHAFENQDVQFEQLVEKLDLERDPSRNPLFDISLAVQNFSKGGTQIQTQDMEPPSEVEVVPAPQTLSPRYESHVSKFDMTFFINEIGQDISIQVQYYTGIFKPESIQRLISHLTHLIKTINQNPTVPLKDIQIISEQEKHQLLYEFNNTQVDYPTHKTIYHLFMEQVERTPDHVALIGETVSTRLDGASNHLSYTTLNHLSSHVAHHLQGRGVGSETIVGILAERSIEAIIGIIGILKSGAAYLPIDPTYPQDRIDYILKDSQAQWVLTGNELASLSSLPPAARYSELPPALAHPQLAYIIYTSGSTGRPKGVMVDHPAIFNTIFFRMQEYQLHTSDRVLQLFSFAFDGFLASFFTPIVSGATVLQLSDRETKDIVRIKELILMMGITHFICVPSLYRSLLELATARELASLTFVTLAAEQVQSDLVEKSKQLYPHLEINNEYGPTENSVSTSLFRDLLPGAIISIGKPIANTHVYIIDPCHQLTPIGIPGQLAISGLGLARGYLNNPQLTADLFLSLSTLSILPTRPTTPYQTLYQSGDLARWLPDGTIEFLGRIDHQVKIRGFRIELGEIENQLLAHPQIKEAVVLASMDSSGENYLCAYIVSPIQWQDSQFRKWLAKDLPDYMIPAYFVPIQHIPLTPNGKVDRRALPHPQLKEKAGYMAPRNPIETQLVQIWSEVLHIENSQIGINSHFFQLGGHSLRATMLVSKIHQRFHVKIPLPEIFKAPFIRDMAAYIQGKSKDLFVAIQPAEEKEYYPLSPAQKRLFILQQLVTHNTGYNMPQIIPITGNASKEDLEQLFMVLIERHDSLRTFFLTVKDEPVQVVQPHIHFSMTVDEIGDYSDSSLLMHRFVKPFDLSKAPLLRVSLLNQGRANSALFIDMHHIITDGVSQGILEQEFFTLATGNTLEPLRLQYKDYSEWYHAPSQQLSIRQQESYWLGEFSQDVPVLQLPTDFPRPSIQGVEGNSVRFYLDPQDTQRLKGCVEKNNISLYMVLIALFNVLLAKLTSQKDIIIGTPIASRRHADLQQVIGMFVNTLAMRHYPAPEKTFSQFLQEVRHRTLDAFENQEYPFEALVEHIQINRDTARNPLFDVMFNVLNQADNTEETIEPTQPDSYVHKQKTSKFDITLNAYEIGQTIAFSLDYSTHLFSPSRINRFIRYFKNILTALVRDESQPIAAIQMMDQEELKEVLLLVNGENTPVEPGKTLHQMFETQATRTPHAIALVGATVGVSASADPDLGLNQWSYHCLNQRAQHLAFQLKARGVVPQTIVAIRVERVIETIFAILAILKAGAAYLPIDPEYPPERVDYMLEDSQALFLLNPVDLFSQVTLPEPPVQHLLPEVGSADLAYIIYTSGSTGRPKGVMVEHASVVNLIAHQRGYFNMLPTDRVLQFSTLCFDASVEQVFLTLTSGATLVLIDKPTLLEQGKFERYMVRQFINHLHAVPFFLNQLDPDSFPYVKRVLTGGDMCPVSLAQKWYQRSSFYNKYGPTETTVVSVEGRVQQIPPHLTSLPIGKPLGNTQVYLLDKTLQLVPVGVTGEIYIGGAGVTRGYLNLPQLTHDTFITLNTPFAPATLLYKTGDLARWLSDGTIEFLGRRDHQVKIRGFRIELGEIENQLLRLPYIQQAVVLARSETSGDKYICAYLVSNADWEVSQIIEHLAHVLPDHMIPAYFVSISHVPLTTSGKIDRLALPAPQIKSDRGYVPPSGPLQEGLVQLWAQVLGVEPQVIGIQGNFFQLGGHSLKATILLSKIQRQLGIHVPLVELFKTPTVYALASYIQLHSATNQETQVPMDDGLVKLKVGEGDAGHLFLIHDGTGEVEGYLEFCKTLDTPFHCWGVRASLWRNGVPQNISIPEIAAHYIRLMQQVQPAGLAPYYLAGWSLGGAITFEVAHQLEKSGERIAFLGLMDSPGPQKQALPQEPPFSLATELDWLLSTFTAPHLTQQLKEASSLSQVWEILLAYLESNQYSVDLIRPFIPLHVAQAIPNFERLGLRELVYALNIHRTLSLARSSYIPRQKLQTPVHYFKASQSPASFIQQWQDYCVHPILSQEIPGDHFSIFRQPDVGQTAKQIALVLT